MINQVDLKLKEHYIEVEIEEAGAKETKKVSYNSLKNIFEDSTQFIDFPLLPGEYGLQKFAKKGLDSLYAYLEPPRLLNVKYESMQEPLFRRNYFTEEEWGITKEEGESEEDFTLRLKERFYDLISKDEYLYLHNYKIVTPRLMWFVHVREKSDGTFAAIDTRLYATKGPLLTGKEDLYVAPFSNVFGSNNICWGKNTVVLPSIKSIQGLSTLFFNAPFNIDLDSNRFLEFEYVRPNNATKNAERFSDLLEKTSMMIEDGEDSENVLSFVESKMFKLPHSFDTEFNRMKSKL